MKKYLLIFIIIFSFLNIEKQAIAAENIYFYKGIFSRKIKIKELIEFKETKNPSIKLNNLLILTNKKEKDLLKVLNHEINMPLILTSQLIYSKIGNIIIDKLSNIIYPNKIYNKNISIPAIRAAIIKASADNNEKINLINFLNAYPNKNVAINLDDLSNTLTKIRALSELIDFYSNSPLENLKDGSTKT